MNKDKFITPVCTPLGQSGDTLFGLPFLPIFAVWHQMHQCGLELAVLT
jgi:hypothetical protein